MKRISAHRLALAALAIPSPLLAQQLGGGGAPEVSIVRIAGALFICLALAFLAILYLKHRSGAPIAFRLGRLVNSQGEIEVVETRRLSVHHQVSLIRHQGRDYLLLLSPGEGLLLHEGKAGSEGGSQ